MRPDIDVDSMEIADAVELAEEGPGDDSVSGEQMRPASTTGQWCGWAMLNDQADQNEPWESAWLRGCEGRGMGCCSTSRTRPQQG